MIPDLSYRKPNELFNKQLFNAGSEWQKDLQWYSTFYRQYDPQIGRFQQYDPCSEYYQSSSPYQYSLNNPITYNDPLGNTAVQWQQNNLIIDFSQIGTNGGFWSSDGGGWTDYGSQDEAFQAGVNYNNQHGSWGYTGETGSGGSFEASRNEYEKSTGKKFINHSGKSGNICYYDSYGGYGKRQKVPIFIESQTKKGEVYSGDNIFAKTFWHYQFGNGKPLDVATSALDFSFVTQKDLAYNPKLNLFTVNLFSLDGTNQTSLALGKVSLKKIGNNMFSIDDDDYDFNIEWSDQYDVMFSNRNIATFGAGLLHGPVIDNIPVLGVLGGPSVIFGGSYKIRFHGVVYIKP